MSQLAKYGEARGELRAAHLSAEHDVLPLFAGCELFECRSAARWNDSGAGRTGDRATPRCWCAVSQQRAAVRAPQRSPPTGSILCEGHRVSARACDGQGIVRQALYAVTKWVSASVRPSSVPTVPPRAISPNLVCIRDKGAVRQVGRDLGHVSRRPGWRDLESGSLGADPCPRAPWPRWYCKRRPHSPERAGPSGASPGVPGPHRGSSRLFLPAAPSSVR
jgi:hypothetical protein